MTLEARAARRAQASDQAARQDRYGHLLGWAAAYTRQQALKAESAVRRRHRAGESHPAWDQRRRDRHADAAADALIAALFYGWVADRLEERAGRYSKSATVVTIGHTFTLKELADLEDRARNEAPDHLDRILHRRER